MEKIIYSLNQEPVKLEIPPPGNVPSFFVFGLHKAGSTMQNKIFKDICDLLNIPIINIPRTSVQQGVGENNLSPDICDIFAQSGYCFLGFRFLPRYLEKFNLTESKKIILIRDPRDILVSHYFSMKKSHTIPEGKIGEKMLKQREKLQNMTVDDYVIDKANIFIDRFNKLALIQDDCFKLFRYEDVVFNKVNWIKDILHFLEMELDSDQIETIAKKQDVFPSQENESSHIRKVTPGDYQEKLKPETITKLNEIFAQILSKYNYPIA